MTAHRLSSLAIVLTTAWLAAACQSSPVRPGAVITQSPPQPSLTFISVTGIVSQASADPAGESMPLPGATIIVSLGPDAYPFFTESDENGRYTLSSVPGTVTVTVSKEGYETQIMAMELVEDVTLNFDLKQSELESLRRGSGRSAVRR